jgi:hypothetical protein
VCSGLSGDWASKWGPQPLLAHTAQSHVWSLGCLHWAPACPFSLGSLTLTYEPCPGRRRECEWGLAISVCFWPTTAGSPSHGFSLEFCFTHGHGTTCRRAARCVDRQLHGMGDGWMRWWPPVRPVVTLRRRPAAGRSIRFHCSGPPAASTHCAPCARIYLDVKIFWLVLSFVYVKYCLIID